LSPTDPFTIENIRTANLENIEQFSVLYLTFNEKGYDHNGYHYNTISTPHGYLGLNVVPSVSSKEPSLVSISYNVTIVFYSKDTSSDYDYFVSGRTRTVDSFKVNSLTINYLYPYDITE
jgi:hypothetical protein